MKSLKKLGVSLLTGLLCMVTVSNTALAAGADSYVTGNDSYRQPVPQSYNVIKTINNIGDYEDKKAFFKDPQDLFVDHNDNIYVVDTNNNRIVKMNSDFETVNIFYGPEDSKFKKPQGIFVDEDGDMYVADTENSRIVHMDPEGNFVEEFLNPETDLETGTAFNPSKLIVSKTGYIYVVKSESIMAIDGNGDFRGYYGQTNIGYDLAEALMRMFAFEEQMKFVTKRLASSYINLTLGDDGMIYATSMERKEGEIKKLNSIGTNIYRKYGNVGNSISNPITDFINDVFAAAVAGQTFKFGEYFDDTGMYMEPVFADICVDDEGIVTVIEQINGKIYQYDQDGNMLVAFGGMGEKVGTFTRPSAIDVDSKGNLYVLDRINCNIQVFEPTEFIQLIHDATSTYNQGKYTESFDLWNKVLAIDENYDLAHVGIARTYYKQGEYKLSMQESELVGNRDVYTMAFDEYKYVVLRQYFVPIILLACAIIAAFAFLVVTLLKYSKKAYWDYMNNKDKKMGIGQGLLFSFNTMVHPMDSLEAVRYNRSRINMAIPFILFITAFVVRMAYLYVVHFPLASIEIKDVNPMFELVKLWIVPISWIPASFMATSISGGESKVREITFCSALSLVPFIVINTPLMFLSNILSKSQSSWYGVFSALAFILMFIIMFLTMMILNNYTLKETIGMMLVSAGLMLVLWLVLFLCYILTGRMVQFVIAIMEEFRLNFL